MKAADGRFEEIEQRLKQARPAEPSAELRRRTIDAAKEVWAKAPADIPWRIPLRHLGISAAAAVLIVSCANYFSRMAVAPWQVGRTGMVRMQVAHSEDMPEMPYSPFVRHLIATSGAPAHDVAALLDYLQNVRRTLDGAEPDDAAGGSGPGERESRLLPAGSKIDSYVEEPPTKWEHDKHHVIASVAKQSLARPFEIASSLRSSQ